MYLKIHNNEMGRIIAVCDKELVGKILTNDKIRMDLDKYKAFYMGEHATEPDVKDALKQFQSANLVGKKAVNVALSAGIIEKEDIMHVNDVPYVQIYKI